MVGCGKYQFFLYLNVVLCVQIVRTKGQKPRVFDHGVNLDTKRPLIIAHRGASGILPEHTVEAYRKAIEQGADVIECDVCVTKDRQLICSHASALNGTTDVSSIPKFASRLTSYTISNELHNEIRYDTFHDWFTVDFTLAELKTLRKKQRLDFRDQNFNGKFQIATFEEYIQIAKNANRAVGLYVETKSPRWVNSLPVMRNTTVEELIVQTLNRYGYISENDPCFLQSFEPDSLNRLRNLTKLPLIRLIKTQAVNTSDDVLAEWSQYLYGIGPWKNLIVPCFSDANGYKINLGTPSDLVERVHRYGLKVHAYVFRNEDRYLAWNFNQDYMEEYDFFINQGIDGFFTDFSKTLSRYLHSLYIEPQKVTSKNVASTASYTRTTKLAQIITNSSEPQLVG